jgi:hypothetical protein
LWGICQAVIYKKIYSAGNTHWQGSCSALP